MNELIHSTNREETITALQKALPFLQKIKDLYLSANGVHQRATQFQTFAQNENATIGRVKSIVVAFFALAAFGMVGSILVIIFPKNGSLALIFLAGLVAVPVYVYRHMMAKDLTERAQKAEERAITELQPQLDSISQEIYRITMENQEVINLLPRDYRYYDAVVFFEKALINGRADNLKEAINLYEEHLHRMALENSNRMILEQNQKQSAMLADIEASSRATARNSAISAAFSVVNFLNHI